MNHYPPVIALLAILLGVCSDSSASSGGGTLPVGPVSRPQAVQSSSLQQLVPFRHRNLQQAGNGGSSSSSRRPECGAACQAAQREALQLLFQVTSGTGWTHSAGWMTAASPCTWFGVTCCTADPPANTTPDESSGPCNLVGGVSHLQLPGNALQGGTLTEVLQGAVVQPLAASLQVLDLSLNQLAGSLPPSVGALTNLQQLYMAETQMSGALPLELSQLRQLEVVDLSGNQLTGALPARDLALAWTELQAIDVSRNLLTGQPPLAFLLNPLIHVLRGGHNRFTGPLDFIIPGTNVTTASLMSAKQHMIHLDLSSNALSGTLPPRMALMQIEYLDLGTNNLSGSIPAVWSGLRSSSLSLADNQLTGTLPPVFPGRFMEAVDLSNNQLVGTLPVSAYLARNLEELILSGNQFNGPIPDSLGDLVFLQRLDIDSTHLASNAPVNAGGSALLPKWLVFNPGDELSSAGKQLVCPNPKTNHSHDPAHPLLVHMDPIYFRFWGCQCIEDTQAEFTYGPLEGASVVVAGEGGSLAPGFPDTPPPGMVPVSMVCVPKVNVDSFPWWAAIVIALGCTALLATALVLLKSHLSVSIVSAAKNVAKRKPPGLGKGKLGQAVTLVLTDVEGSTELWEWDNEVMSTALDLHDRTLRYHMEQHYGYEVQTEGDAFLIAFHEPSDAVAWCIATQLALLLAPWPSELLGHMKASIETVSTLEAESKPKKLGQTVPSTPRLRVSGSIPAVLDLETLILDSSGWESRTPSVGASGLVLRGLRVRMGVATGPVDEVSAHPVTGRLEYSGELLRRTQAVADLPHGSQVLIDDLTFKEINSHLAGLGASIMSAFQKRQSVTLPRLHSKGLGMPTTTPPSVLITHRPWVPQPSNLSSVAQLLLVTSDADASHSYHQHSPSTAPAHHQHSPSTGQQQPHSPAQELLRDNNTQLTFQCQTSSGGELPRLTSMDGTSPPRLSNTGRYDSGFKFPEVDGTEHVSPNAGAALNDPAVSGRLPSVLEDHSGAPPQPWQMSAAPTSTTLAPMLPQSSLDGATVNGRRFLNPLEGRLNPMSGPPARLVQSSPSIGAQADSRPGQEETSEPPLYHLTSWSSGALPTSRVPASSPGLTARSQSVLSQPPLHTPTNLAIVGTRSRSMALPRHPRAASMEIGRSFDLQGTIIPPSSPSKSSIPLLNPSKSFRATMKLARSFLQSSGSAAPLEEVDPENPAGISQEGSLSESSMASRGEAAGTSLMVVHMGTYELLPGICFDDVIQVMPPGLEDRARLLPRISPSTQVTPGFLDAPSALCMPMGNHHHHHHHHHHHRHHHRHHTHLELALQSGPLPNVSSFRTGHQQAPPVTMVFCGMDKYAEMCATNVMVARQVLALYNTTIRRTLLACSGYECQEAAGNYMIVFPEPGAALEWCCMVQEVMMEVPWSTSQLELPHNGTQPLTLLPSSPLVFNGPRVKFGMYQEVPTKIVPHSTTGRADYFGPLVNRAARCCHACCSPGQVVAPIELVRQVLAAWLPELLLDSLLRSSSHNHSHEKLQRTSLTRTSFTRTTSTTPKRSHKRAPAPPVHPNELTVTAIATVDNSTVQLSRYALPTDLQLATHMTRRNSVLAELTAMESARKGLIPPSVDPAVRVSVSGNARSSFTSTARLVRKATTLQDTPAPIPELDGSEAFFARGTSQSRQSVRRHSLLLDGEWFEDSGAFASIPVNANTLSPLALKAAYKQQKPPWLTASNQPSHSASRNVVDMPLVGGDPLAQAQGRLLHERSSRGSLSPPSVRPLPAAGSRLRTTSAAGASPQQEREWERARERAHSQAAAVVAVHSDDSSHGGATTGPDTSSHGPPHRRATSSHGPSSHRLEGSSHGGDMRREYDAHDHFHMPQTQVKGKNVLLQYAASIRSRTGKNKWLWMQELTIEDLGYFKYKGVQSEMRMVSLSTARTVARTFPSKRKNSSKGVQVTPGQGRMLKVVFRAAANSEPPPQPTQLSAHHPMLLN